MPLRISVVVDSDAFEDSADIGIIEGKLLGPTPVLCSKLTFLRAAFFAEMHAAPVVNTNSEPCADLWGSDPFHHLADRKARSGAILFGGGPGQKLPDVFITDLCAGVCSTDPPHFDHPGEQCFAINLAVCLGAGQAIDLIEKAAGCGSQTVLDDALMVALGLLRS